MSVAVTCPECQTRIEVPEMLADQPIRCLRCQQPMACDLSAGIQATALPMPALAKRRVEEPPPISPRRPTAQAPFPLMSVLVVLLGLMFLALVFSAGFNVWFLVTPENHFRRMDEAMRAQKEAQVLLQQAVQAAEDARQKQREEVRKLGVQNDELQNELKALKEQRDEAQRRLEKLK